ncbi:acriflavin resistance protein [Rubrivirga sp. SAORIC476]|uniref:efflux RND transporter permease subunit n=1 Tax=Rubrivirga sp. SAORIC476 TaxID=1961794 RepID=UPI000BA94023|nr:efflux RND transporter permease subunit [Rubrivirga sp. SAORIC476]MBC14648.1 AcrB/AcrD/AcrF family protein [Rhodothermaceae bacterium]PAP80431.1 acriflavin resistance protein [Rubrivirga sp. SAORIC476]
MASLYDVSVRRPVFATVMSLTILIGGVIGYQRLGVREYPIVETPVISVSTSLRGANAAVIESQVTEPIEESVNAIDGIRSITSTSNEGRSTVRVEFDLGADLDRAAADVRDRVSRARGRIPDEAEEPVISKSNSDGQPVVFLNLSSEQYDLLELSEIADNFFAERLQTIDGVASVDIWGDKRYAMRMWIDPAALAAYGLTPGDVQRAVQEQNVELPGGRIEGDQVELTIRPLTRLSTVEEFENLILKNDGTSLVRFSDVGRVELAAQNQRTVLKRDGVAMVGVVLRPLADANAIDIVDEFYRRVDDIKEDLPPGIEMGIGFDNTEPIRASIEEVRETILIALALVILVIFGFLRDWRTTLVPVVVIPVSLVGAFGVMALAGFSINVLTLLALVLAIGLVVDDAIVVLENIYAKIEDGMDPLQAAVVGTKEIYIAVIATTLALVAVFLPIIFQSGVIGALFREFGLTIAAAVVISSFAALTLTPMLSSKLLKRRETKPWLYRKTEPFFERTNDAYRRTLSAFLRVRWMAFVVMAVASVGVWWLFSNLESELAPAEDRSQIRLFANAPQGRGYAYMDAYTDELIALIQREVPEVEALISVTSPGFGSSGSVNSAFANLILVPPDERERSQDDIANGLQRALGSLPGARVNASQPATISTSSGRGSPVQLVIQAPNLVALQDALPAFLEAAGQDPAFQFVRADLEFTLPELQIEVDRDRAQALGIAPLDVAQALSVALSEGRYGYFNRNGEQYEIIGQLEREARDTPNALQGLYVRSAAGQPIPLSNLVTLTESAAPPQLYRFNRFTAATVSAEPAEGVSLGDAIDAMEAVARETLPVGFSTALDGQSRDFRESGGSILVVFGLALVLIYLVLAAQFESFRDPITILLTVPLALLGALGALWVFGSTLNVFSQIGLVMLIGLVTKNGILIVEFAKQKREEGMGRQQAAEEASAARFRPILMTAFSTVLGTLPIALALGAGAESRVPMGLAVIGGLVVGTFLTLYVIPALYTFIASKEVGVVPLSVAGDGATTAIPERPVRLGPETGGDGSEAEAPAALIEPDRDAS